MNAITVFLLLVQCYPSRTGIGTKILPTVFAVLMMLLSFLCLRMIFEKLRRRKLCTARVEAEIVSYIEKEETTSGSDGVLMKTKVYAPVYSFFYRGQEYRVESPTYLGYPLRKKKKATIRVNPNQPEMIFELSREIISMIGAVIFCGIFLFLTVLLLIGMIFWV